MFEFVGMWVHVCVLSINLAVYCLTAQKSSQNSSLPLGLGIPVFERNLRSWASILS